MIAVSAALRAEEGGAEDDYFGALPVVLTVSRLAQPLSDTPGAVTVLDRDKIRRSGARDVADLMRMVPGYMVAGWNGANPNAAYHAPVDEYGTRNLVLIDGRSVYSPFYLGNTNKGMLGVMLEDIERIEVLRGSNSAAYGANAMFGVINIVTRHSGDTHGAEIVVAGGNDGLADVRARVGWGNDAASFRLSTGRRADHGYRNAFDDMVLRQTHFRADLRPSVSDDMLVEAGGTEFSGGEGFLADPGNSQRTVFWNDWYLHGQWRRQLSDTDEIKVSANVDQERIHDSTPYAPLPAVLLDFGGEGRRYNVEIQHQLGLTQSLRAVWGLGFKREEALSKAIYGQDHPITFNESRLFGNLEWRFSPRWLVNAALFLGDHSWTGGYAAPRIMVNYELTPDHTLRMGAGKSVRTPSLYELAGDVRYYLGGVLLQRPTAARGNVRPETLLTQELGYFGNFREARLTLDVRAYHEEMKGYIDAKSYTLPAPVPLLDPQGEDYVNTPGLRSFGVEYQLRWQPWDTTEVWVNQNWQHYSWSDSDRDDRSPPTYASSVMLFQKLPGGLDLSVSFHNNGKMTWRGQDNLTNSRRFDMRLAYPFRIDGVRAEVAVVAQSLNGRQPIFQPSEQFMFDRRLFGTLRIEY